MDDRAEILAALDLPTDPALCTHADAQPPSFCCGTCAGYPLGCAGCSSVHNTCSRISLERAAGLQRLHLQTLTDQTPAQPAALPVLRMIDSVSTALPAVAGVEAPELSLAEKEVCELMRALMAELAELPGNVEASRQRAIDRQKEALAAAASEDAALEIQATFEALLADIESAEASRTRELEVEISAADAGLVLLQDEFALARKVCGPALLDADVVGGAYAASLARLTAVFSALKRLPQVRRSGVCGASAGELRRGVRDRTCYDALCLSRIS
jgi:hypothetical protein